MACVSVDTLAAYVDGTATHAERMQVQIHLGRCERCALVLRAVEETRKLVPPHE